jgi:protein O-mannosyl-transferase
VMLFALLWFLAGHLIESTFIPLELYFEHRNYIASLGPLLAACVLLWHVPAKVLRIALAGLALMVLLRMFVLGETAHLRGQPLLAARVWSEEHPQSPRAAQFLAMMYFDAEDKEAMRIATLDGHTRIKNDITLALQSAYLSCQHDDQSEFISRLKDLESVLPTGTGGISAPELLDKMFEAQQKGGCPNLTLDHLYRLADALLVNPHLQAAPGIMAALHVFKYRLYALQGKPNLSARELFTAFSLKRELSIALAAARVASDAGHYDDAITFLNRAMLFAPRNPILKQHWRTEFDKLKSSIEQKRSLALPRKVDQ